MNEMKSLIRSLYFVIRSSCVGADLNFNVYEFDILYTCLLIFTNLFIHIKYTNIFVAC